MVFVTLPVDLVNEVKVHVELTILVCIKKNVPEVSGKNTQIHTKLQSVPYWVFFYKMIFNSYCTVKVTINIAVYREFIELFTVKDLKNSLSQNCY